MVFIMKYENNLYWPDDETHLTEFGLEYQKDIRDEAIKLCSSRILAVDVGAHVGIATLHFTTQFRNTLSFEPIPETFACLRKNINASGDDGIIAVNAPLSDCNHAVEFTYNIGNTGYTVPRSALSGQQTLFLDQFHLHPNLIKVDVEGFEPYVIRGARETIARCSPVMLIEVKGVGTASTNPREPLDLLEGMGYTIRKQINHDFILTR